MMKNISYFTAKVRWAPTLFGRTGVRDPLGDYNVTAFMVGAQAFLEVEESTRAHNPLSPSVMPAVD